MKSAAPHLERDKSAVSRERSAEKGAVHASPLFFSANVSQHAAIFDLLHGTYSAYSHEDFTSWLEEPSYDPADRVLLTINHELVGHAHLTMRYVTFYGVRLPVALVREFALRSEFRDSDLEAALLHHVEFAASQRGAVAALLCGRGIRHSLHASWHSLPGRGYSSADPQVVLSRLQERPAEFVRRGRGSRIGLWRRMDLDGLMSLYAADASTRWGSIVRNEAYWQWLLSLPTHDAVIVATVARNRRSSRELHPPLIGYAITKRHHVLEVVTMQDGDGQRLLARLCRDAVERGDHTITLHTPADDPLHQVLLEADGTWCDTARDGVHPTWCKLLDRKRWVEALFPVWHESVREHGLTPPCTLSIELPDSDGELVVSRRSSQWQENAKSGREADVICDENVLSKLLLGHQSWETIQKEGLLTVAQPQSTRLLSSLFTPRPWHFTLMDWL